ncbi:TrkH family potassium uptake protein [Halococcus sediminicola]|uniref:TrkH family potassium uptake protein n=1 Tax=Halococcus sediminicola TaxID=1264579 RepID=UPI000679252D|nr:potassium transporter TrkG [Halococcus sediminicola]
MHEGYHRVLADIGELFTYYAGLPLLSIVVALVWREWFMIPVLLLTAALVFAFGWSLQSRYGEAGEAETVQGILVVLLAWGLAGVVNALPLLFAAWATQFGFPNVPAASPALATFLNPMNALFEGMSGVTGSGFSMASRPDLLPATIQWWRSLSQWLGGIGVIVLAAAVVSTSENESFTEIHGNKAPTETIRSTTIGTAAAIWWMLAYFTVIAILLLWLAGMPPWEAINHAMTGLTTGGFSIVPDSMGYYGPRVQAALIPVMMLGATSFSVLFFALQGDGEHLIRDAQTKWLVGAFGVGVVAVVGVVVGTNIYRTIPRAIRYGGFQLVSALSTTGFQTASNLGSRWPAVGKLLLIIAMIGGGAAGSTAGGLKVVRVRSLLKEAPINAVDVAEHERDVGSEMRGEASAEFGGAAAIAHLWFLMLAVATVVCLLALPISASGFSPVDVLFEVASAASNVGLSTDVIGASSPPLVKGVFVLVMWVGRIEIIPIVVAGQVLLNRGVDL